MFISILYRVNIVVLSLALIIIQNCLGKGCLLVLKHKIGDIIYIYDITAAKEGPSLFSFIPPKVT